jgi:hypothetical protein
MMSDWIKCVNQMSISEWLREFERNKRLLEQARESLKRYLAGKLK